MNRTLLAGGLALLALVAHFAIPFVTLQFDEEDGTSHQSTHWPPGFADREAEFDPVPGGSMGYMWTGLSLLALGSIALWLVPKFTQRAAATALAGGVGLLGATLSIHAQALWIGRSIASLAHLLLGTDGPSKKHLADAFSGDYYTSVWVISPWVVLALALAAAWFLLQHLASLVPDDKGRQVQATRHADIAKFVLIGLAVLFVVPWSAQDLDDNTPAGESQDQDPFVLSMYDALRLQTDTSQVAKDSGEAGLEEYSELAIFAKLFVISAALVCLATLSGIMGNLLMANQDGSTGRLLESAVYVNGLLVIGLAIMVPLAALLWFAPNDRLTADRTWVPVLAVPLFVLGLTRVVAIFKDMSEGADNLISDDFPEPILYD